MYVIESKSDRVKKKVDGMRREKNDLVTLENDKIFLI